MDIPDRNDLNTDLIDVSLASFCSINSFYYLPFFLTNFPTQLSSRLPVCLFPPLLPSLSYLPLCYPHCFHFTARRFGSPTISPIPFLILVSPSLPLPISSHHNNLISAFSTPVFKSKSYHFLSARNHKIIQETRDRPSRDCIPSCGSFPTYAPHIEGGGPARASAFLRTRCLPLAESRS